MAQALSSGCWAPSLCSAWAHSLCSRSANFVFRRWLGIGLQTVRTDCLPAGAMRFETPKVTLCALRRSRSRRGHRDSRSRCARCGTKCYKSTPRGPSRATGQLHWHCASRLGWLPLSLSLCITMATTLSPTVHHDGYHSLSHCASRWLPLSLPLCMTTRMATTLSSYASGPWPSRRKQRTCASAPLP